MVKEGWMVEVVDGERWMDGGRWMDGERGMDGGMCAIEKCLKV